MPQAWEHEVPATIKRKTALQTMSYSRLEERFLALAYPQSDLPSLEMGTLAHSVRRLIARAKSQGTLRSYTATISYWMDFAREKNLPTNPATVLGVCAYISHLADKKAPFSTILKISPALTFLHDCQNHTTAPAVQKPVVKLVLDGAKREAAERRPPVKKATGLTQSQIHEIVDLLWKKGVGVIDDKVSLKDWRSIVRIYLMYKTLCRNDCYNEVLSTDVKFEEDHVQINFCRAKNDKYYDGSVSILACLPEEPAYCPKVILSRYFQVMSFDLKKTEYLNCRLRYSRRNGLAPISNMPMAYSTALEESRQLCHSLGFEGNFSEKSYKVAGVSQGFDSGMTSEEMANHGRWKSTDTPKIYYSQNKKNKMDISKKMS